MVVVIVKEMKAVMLLIVIVMLDIIKENPNFVGTYNVGPTSP